MITHIEDLCICFHLLLSFVTQTLKRVTNTTHWPFRIDDKGGSLSRNWLLCRNRTQFNIRLYNRYEIYTRSFADIAETLFIH